MKRGTTALKYFVVGIALAIVVMMAFMSSHVSTTKPTLHVLAMKPIHSRTVGNKSYMLSLTYAEQLTMATAHYIQFINLVAGWNLTGVEPYVHTSRMFGLHSDSVPISSFYKYSLFLNISALNAELSDCLERATDMEKDGTVLFESINEFMNQSYRDIVIVYFSKHMRVFSREIHAAMDRNVAFGDQPIKDCTETSRDKGLSEQVEVKLAQEFAFMRNESKFSSLPHTNGDFKVLQAFCVEKSTPITLVQLRDYVLSHIRHDTNGKKLNVSIMFISWQGRFTHPFKDLETMNRCRLLPSQIKYSNKVLDTAHQFIHSLGLRKSSYISVHIRFAKLFLHHKTDSDNFYECCMKKVNVLVGMVQRKSGITSDGVLLIQDFGTYGTDACRFNGLYLAHHLCIEKSTKLISQLNMTLAKFDPVKFDAPINSGFASLVEAASLFGGRLLITVGEGSYQHSLINRFIEQHHDPGNPEAASKLHYHLQCMESPGPETVNGLVIPGTVCQSLDIIV